MKTVLAFAIVFFMSMSLVGQSVIKVYSPIKDERSYVLLAINDVKQDAAYYAEAEIEGLKPGRYELRVSFNSDTIADVIETVEVPEDTKIIFKVEAKTAMGKEIGTLGRSMGRLFGVTRKDDKAGLKEAYKVTKVSEIKLN